jgi:hypothetical protein
MKTAATIALTVASILIAAPVAWADERRGAGGPGAGGPVVLDREIAGQPVMGAPGAGGPVLGNDVFGRDPIAGPGGSGPVVDVTQDITGSGFDWLAVSLGMALAAGLALVVAGVVLHVRRRSELAMPQH